jgi:hypothetical protein
MVRFLGRIVCRFASAAAVFAVAAAVAQAAPISISVSSTTGYYGASTEGSLGSDGQTYSASGVGLGSNNAFTCNWSVSFDHDPQYLASFDITNTTGLTQTFTLNVTLPVSPAILGSSLMNGYFGKLDWYDANSDGSVTVNTVGATKFFVAKIDTAGVQGIGTFSAGATSAPGGIFGDYPQQSFGIPTQLAGPAVLSSIGGTVVFQLTPGDRAVFPIFFQVNPVPEPFTALLVGFGLLGLAAIRQRRA